MRRRYLSALTLASLLCFTSLLPAQQTFSDPAEFEAALCGTLLPNGEGAFTPPEFNNANDINFEFDQSLGSVEGFCLTFGGGGEIQIFDGETVVDTIEVIFEAGTTIFDTRTICWLNTTGLNVTRIEGSNNILVPSFPDVFNDFQVAIKPDVVSCRSLLQDLIADVAAIAPVEGSSDESLLYYATAFLGCADHDSLWIDDDNRVVNCDAFFFLYKATKFLSFVSEGPEVDQALADIQEVLSCITDNEIAAAEAAEGDASLIGCASYFQSCADANQEIGFFRKATVLRKLAWYKAAAAY